MAALTAGAAAAAMDTAGAAIKDGYQGLKALLQNKLAGNQAATVVLEEHAMDPVTFRKGVTPWLPLRRPR